MNLRNDQLTGSVGDFARAIALGSLNMADAQRRACDLLGIPRPDPAGTAHALIAEMEQPRELDEWEEADTARAFAANALTCSDYDDSYDEPAPEVEHINLPSFQTYEADRRRMLAVARAWATEAEAAGTGREG